MTDKNPFPVWNKAQPQQSLEAVYSWAVKNAEQSIAYYMVKKKPNRTLSRGLRFFSIFFVAVGALCPLIDATKVVEKYVSPDISLAQWGYVFLAVSAAIVGFDYYFGHSSGWMRYIVTEIAVSRLLKEFQIDWAILEVEQTKNSTETKMLVFLERAKTFTLQIENLVKQETDSWVTEFQANIAQLEKVLKTETKGRQQTTPDSL